jgi:isocitrate dehydrogenase
MSNNAKQITVAYGDGIGPEIMDATLRILKEAGANISIESVTVGQEAYLRDNTSGITSSSWESIHSTKTMLKAPITTPQGGGFKSVNVTLRKALGLFANIRPCQSYFPFIKTNHPTMDVVIIRENEEDLYAGVEYRKTEEMHQTLKLISKTGSEKIIRYAFEYAIKNGRKKITCFSKDNIMKITDGLFHKVFDTIAKDYPLIETDHMIVDIGSARLAVKPEKFDVIVTENLYGDIISDIAAEITGSVGLAGSANIGKEYAVFEAIHGSAPDIAGQNIANPSGLLNAAIMMLVHINQPTVASLIQNAWLKTIEEGIHTQDIYNNDTSKKLVGTKEFADEVISNLGKNPEKLKSVEYSSNEVKTPSLSSNTITEKEKKQLVGVDIFIDWLGKPDDLANMINKLNDLELQLQMISQRGLTMWPNKKVATDLIDYWRLRFVPSRPEKTTNHSEVLMLMSKLIEHGFDIVETHNLYSYNDKIGFSLGQGE